MFFTKKPQDIVGIDIGSSSLKLVQLKEQQGELHLLNAAVIPLSSEAIVDNALMDSLAIVGCIKSLVATSGVKCRNVAASISGNSVIIRKIMLPTMSQDELEEQIGWEAEQYIPFDISDIFMDFQILPEETRDPSQMSVLLVASKKNIVHDYQTVFSQAGLILSIVDIDSFATQNAFECNHVVQPDEICALVNIGANIMTINIVKGGITLHTRDVQSGGNMYTEELQKQLGLSSSESESLKVLAHEVKSPRILTIIDKVNDVVTQEIRRSLDFYHSSAGDDRVNRLFISGGCSKVYNLQEALHQKTGLTVELINPFAHVRYSDKDFDAEYLGEIGPLMTVAVGLAMRRIGDK